MSENCVFGIGDVIMESKTVPESMKCPNCWRIIEPKFWGGNDWRYGCYCGFVKMDWAIERKTDE